MVPVQSKILAGALVGLMVLFIGFAWWVWFATSGRFSIALPIVVTVLPVVIALLFLVLGRLQGRKRAGGIEQAIAAQAQKQASAQPGHAAEVERLQLEFGRAVDALKKSRLAKGSRDGRDALYRLPWYAIIGPPACGKTTVLRNSGLRFPHVSGTDPRLKGIGGTRNCDWFLTNHAVLLDTAGRWSTEQEDHHEWLAFLELLKRHRPRRPLNGLIAAIGVDTLAASEPAELEQLAARMRQRLDEVSVGLGMALPIYLLLTKCDLVRGFVESFGDLARDERKQIWGFTAPLLRPIGEPAAFFEARFGDLCTQLERRALTRLPDEIQPGTLRLVYGFPHQFRALSAKLSQFTGLLFEHNVYRETPIFRGAYFTSGTQEGAPADVVMGELARALNIQELLPDAPAVSQPKEYFLHDMLMDVVFADEALATVSQVELLRERKVRTVWTSSTFIVALLLALLPGYAFLRNLHALDETTALVGAQPALTPPLAAGQPLARAALEPLAREVLRYERGRPSLSAGFGMYQGGALLAPLQIYYGDVLKTGVIEPLLAADGLKTRQLVQQLESVRRERAGDWAPLEAAQRHQLLDTLKLQLLLSKQPAKSPAAHKAELLAALATRWDAVATEPSDHAFHEAQVKRYLELLAERPQELAVQLDADTVRRVRQALGSEKSTDRALNDLLSRFHDLDLNLAKLSETRGALSGGRDIPGAFTREAWPMIWQMIDQGTVWDNVGEQWVLGPVGAEASDAGLQEQRGRELRAAYLKQYAEHWRRFILTIAVERPTSITAAEAVMKELAERDGPLPKLLKGVQDNLTLSEPAPSNPAAQLVKQAGAAVDKFLPGAGERLAGKSAAEDLKKLPQALAGFTGFGNQLVQYQSELGKVLAAIAAYQQDETTKDQLSSAVQSARTFVDTTVAGMPSDFGSVWASILRPPLYAVGDTVEAQSRCEFEQQWRNEIVTVFNQKLAGRFPLSLRGEADATLADFTAFYRPADGTLWSFLKQHLEPRVVREAGRHFALASDPFGAGYSAELPAYLERSRDLTEAFFAGGGAPKLRLQLRIRGADDLERTELTVGAQTFTYSNGPLHWETLEWPGPKPEAGASLKVVRNDAQPRAPLERTGVWGLFRLLQRGLVTASTPPRAVTVAWRPGKNDRQLEIDLMVSNDMLPLLVQACWHPDQNRFVPLCDAWAPQFPSSGVTPVPPERIVAATQCRLGVP